MLHFAYFKRETFEFWVVPEQVTHLVRDAERDGTMIHLAGGQAVLVNGAPDEVATKLVQP